MKTKYASEYKKSIVERFYSGESVFSIQTDTGVSRSSIYNWINEDNKLKNKNKPRVFTLRERNDMQNRIIRLESMVKILQAMPSFKQSTLQEKLNFAEEIYKDYKVNLTCDALMIDRGTFLNHIKRNKRNNSVYARKREALKPIINEVFYDNKQIFGAAKITAILHEMGWKVSKKTVADIMHDMGLFSIRNSSKEFYQRNQKKKKNYLNQNFNTSAPNQVWTSDVTYIKVKDCPYYICVIMDLFSRKIIAYNISNTNNSRLVNTTLKKAYLIRKPKCGLIFHSDRGANYTSSSFQKLLNSYNITQSFSRAGMPYDNSVTESFFSSFKQEELYRTNYRSRRDFKYHVDEYMLYYNKERPHSYNNYKSPDKIESEYYKKTK